MTVVERGKANEQRYSVFSEPRHREAAKYISGISDATDVCPSLKNLRKENRAVLIIYRVIPKVRDAKDTEDFISIGFGMQFPSNKIKTEIKWGVVDQKIRMPSSLLSANKIWLGGLKSEVQHLAIR